MNACNNDKLYRIKNAALVLPTGICRHKSLIINDGKIVAIEDDKLSGERMPELDAKGLFVAPGCIDTHVHGGGGFDFLDATPEAFRTIASTHVKHGTTAIYPTLAAAPLSVFRQSIKTCEKIMDETPQGARVMGLHLEGNYLNKDMCGGQDPAYLSLPCENEYKALLSETSCIKRWSAAPELPGALDFARFASKQGVVVSLAHTVADYAMVSEAWEAGYTHATHFYNAMTGVHKAGEYKHEGTIEAVYLIDDMTVEMIADGIHVPPAILKLIYKIKGPDKIMLVTDAMAAASCEEGTFIHNGRIILEDGVCKLADRSALAGSVATADRLIRTLVKQVGIPLPDAVRMASETPARIMGIFDTKGELACGKDADIIIFDPNIEIKTTIVEGRIVYNRL